MTGARAFKWIVVLDPLWQVVHVEPYAGHVTAARALATRRAIALKQNTRIGSLSSEDSPGPVVLWIPDQQHIQSAPDFYRRNRWFVSYRFKRESPFKSFSVPLEEWDHFAWGNNRLAKEWGVFLEPVITRALTAKLQGT